MPTVWTPTVPCHCSQQYWKTSNVDHTPCSDHFWHAPGVCFTQWALATHFCSNFIGSKGTKAHTNLQNCSPSEFVEARVKRHRKDCSWCKNGRKGLVFRFDCWISRAKLDQMNPHSGLKRERGWSFTQNFSWENEVYLEIGHLQILPRLPSRAKDTVSRELVWAVFFCQWLEFSRNTNVSFSWKFGKWKTKATSFEIPVSWAQKRIKTW